MCQIWFTISKWKLPKPMTISQKAVPFLNFLSPISVSPCSCKKMSTRLTKSQHLLRCPAWLVLDVLFLMQENTFSKKISKSIILGIKPYSSDCMYLQYLLKHSFSKVIALPIAVKPEENWSFNTVHGETTYESHTDDIRVHTSDIRMAYEYIRVRKRLVFSPSILVLFLIMEIVKKIWSSTGN